MRELEYPFDSEFILKKSKKIKRLLLEKGEEAFLSKRIAVLGGSTTHDIVRILDLFLLNEGIKAVFYQSEFNRYWQEAMFDNQALQEFEPDIIFIHTSNRNITGYPALSDTEREVEEKLKEEFAHFTVMWDRLREIYRCPVIQNNFEYPFYRMLGNRETSDIHGKNYYINRLNLLFAGYAGQHENFYIHDIHYLSAAYGLDQWADPFYWHMYKYALHIQAIPEFAFSLSHIIKSLFGKNKKGLVLDLDNTLWGGIVGDEGAEQLEIGPETSMGQVYGEFQSYLKAHKELGIVLNVNSKNEYENALAGLRHPDSLLKPEDFILIKANWEPKSRNLLDIAAELGVLPEALVFVDDNPAEREIVRQQAAGVAVPEITGTGREARKTGGSHEVSRKETGGSRDDHTKARPEQYIRILDKNGYFEVTGISEEDRKRNEMYRTNVIRKQQASTYEDYEEYLHSLEMAGTIKAFEPVYLARIAQLTNKSNQFNVTTKRFTQTEIEEIAANDSYLTLYGRLVDKFGDNGVVSVVIGRVEDTTLHLELWLMSCRVLKRDMEYAMMDQVVMECQKRGILRICGYYYPTAKNSMVKEFYRQQGFEKLQEDKEGNTLWEFLIPEAYQKKNKVIRVNSEEGEADDQRRNI